jgi:hypothetical protein
MERRQFIKGAMIGGGLLGAGMLKDVGQALAQSGSKEEKKNAPKRSLILYASRTGNTIRVAERFKSVLEKNNWQCDMFKIEQNSDPMTFPYDFKGYDLICAGTGVRMHSPYAELLHVLRVPVYGYDPRIILKYAEGIELTKEESEIMRAGGTPKHGKILLGPYAPKALAFCTYGGFEFGPGEAYPALDWINLELAHLKVEIVGKFCCPGRMGNISSPTGYHKDLPQRPTDRDLLRAELFMEGILEHIADRLPVDAP